MSKLLLLYLTFIVGLVFLILPEQVSTRDFFPMYDIQMYLSTYIYFILEKSILILFAAIIYNEATEYRGEIRVFIFLLIFDLIDYFLSYNTVWFRVGEFPVSMNVMKCILFGITILNAWIRNSFK